MAQGRQARRAFAKARLALAERTEGLHFLLDLGVMQASFGTFGDDFMNLSEREPPRPPSWQGEANDRPSHAAREAGEPTDGYREPM